MVSLGLVGGLGVFGLGGAACRMQSVLVFRSDSERMRMTKKNQEPVDLKEFGKFGRLS